VHFSKSISGDFLSKKLIFYILVRFGGSLQPKLGEIREEGGGNDHSKLLSGKSNITVSTSSSF